MDKNLYDDIGNLLLFNNITKKDIDLFLDTIAWGQYSYLSLLRTLVKDDMALIKLLDVMAGCKVQFPNRRKVYKALERVSIYNYCASRDFSEDSYRIVSRQYHRRIPQVRSMVSVMQKFIDNQMSTEDKALMDKYVKE